MARHLTFVPNPKLPQQLVDDQRVVVAVGEVADMLVEELRVTTPRDTGELADTIDRTVVMQDGRGLRVVVVLGRGFKGWYAAFVEFGTRHAPGRHFAARALRNVAERLQKGSVR